MTRVVNTVLSVAAFYYDIKPSSTLICVNKMKYG